MNDFLPWLLIAACCVLMVWAFRWEQKIRAKMTEEEKVAEQWRDAW